jgi:cytochrome c-type biogenesis protein CcmH/NrfG
VDGLSHRPGILAILIVGAVLLAHGRVLGFDFVNFDDPRYVIENPRVLDGLTWDGAAWSLTAVHFFNWHPLTWLSHMLDVELFGTVAAGHHATNLMLHIANTLVLFGLLRRTTGATGRSAWVAAAFALHPLHVESVAWVSERKDLLSAFFFLLAIWSHVRWVERPSIRRYAAVVGCFALGLASKPMVATLPLVLLLVDHWPLGRWRASEAGRLVTEKLPLFALAAASAVMTMLAQQQAIVPEALPLHLRLANASWSYAAYLGMTLWPVDLSPYHPHPYLPGMGGTPLGALRVTVAAFVILGLTAIVLRARRAYAVCGWLWYLVMLLPVVGLLQAGGQGMADRYTYLPLVGVFVIFAWGGHEAIARVEGLRPRLGPPLRTAAVAALAACVPLSSMQAGHWRDSEFLWERVISLKRSSMAHFNLASHLRAVGRQEEAILHLESVIQIEPTSAKAMNELGVTFQRMGRLDEAAQVLQRSIEVGPSNARAHLLLGGVLEEQGQLDAAIEHYRAALEARPNSDRARRALEAAQKHQGS